MAVQSARRLGATRVIEAWRLAAPEHSMTVEDMLSGEGAHSPLSTIFGLLPLLFETNLQTLVPNPDGNNFGMERGCGRGSVLVLAPSILRVHEPLDG